MENPVTSVSKFVKATVAFLTGDTDTAIALKNERLAKASIKGQLSALEGALVEAEVEVTNAQEALEKAIYPTTQIANQHGYYKNIIGAQERLNEATSKLEDTKTAISYAEKLLADKF